MPSKYEYGEEDFLFLKHELEQMGYRQKSEINFKGDFKRLGLQAPRPKPGREEGFIFASDRFLNAIIWTSYVAADKAFRGEDVGWSLITEGDYAKYFAKPVRRTEGFLLQILRKAWITAWRVKHRPFCPTCDALMSIHEKKKHGKPTGQYFWACFHQKSNTQPPIFVGWDTIGPEKKLPPKAKEYVDKTRARIKAYKKRNKKLGITRTPMRSIRKSWVVTKPENRKK